MCAEDAMLHYLDSNKPFDVHINNIRKYQMGALISQNGRPVAYWSRKLSVPQKKYPTTDHELLAIINCIKQYKTILFGQRITVWIDHKSLIYKNTKHANDRVLRQ